MGEVFYSSMKFKKNLRQGTAATQDEDVTYSEVKNINPTTSNTVCHCGSAGHSGQSSHPYRRAAVCLGLLCALLLAATLVLCVLYTSLSGNYSMLERDLEELRSNCSTMNREKVKQHNTSQSEKYSMLEKDLEELRTSCNTMKVQQQEKYSILEGDLEKLRSNWSTMNEEKVQQQKKYSMLEKNLEELTTSCNMTMVQQQRKYNEVFKKLPFLEQYCPSSSQSRVCEPCPQGWEQFSSKCYYFSNEKKNREDSRSDCLERGADLVIIESEEEQQFINKQTKNWIGLSRSDFKSNWLWVDGTPLQKGFWGSGEPDHQSGFDCALNDPEMNGWDAYYCYNKEYWICETNALLP